MIWGAKYDFEPSLLTVIDGYTIEFVRLDLKIFLRSTPTEKAQGNFAL